jgi:hypothetical protein
MKKVYREDAVYKRTKSGRYIDIGHEVTGFPTDGIWLVQNGRSSMTCLIGAKERVPMFALNYRVHKDGLCRRLQMDLGKKPHSWDDISKTACDYFAELMEGKK